MKSPLHATYAALVLAFAALALSGCGGGATIESVCGKCSKASDACVAEYTATQKLASQKGCDAQFQAIVDCLDNKAVCDASGELSGDNCAAETLDFATCTGGMN